ncbi:hypothetical protein ABVN23_28440 [Pseudomonas fluorescens]|uniref:hypothetical protein n=1 Tax=Pseudomonas fluorescens TaxID=294 RepID=UPI003F9CCA53
MSGQVGRNFPRSGRLSRKPGAIHPLEATLLFSRLMWEKVGDRYGDLYLTQEQFDAFAAQT